MAEGDGNGQRLDRAPAEEGTKKHHTRDPTAPRPAKSAFAFFAEENSHIVGLKKPDGTSSLAAILGQVWTGLSGADKVPYEQTAAADKARYEREMANLREKAKL